MTERHLTARRRIRTARTRFTASAAATAVAAALIATSVVGPARAEPVSLGEDPIVLDAWNGFTAYIDPATSRIRVTTPTPLEWDPNLAQVDWREGGVDRFAFGVGWTFGTHFVVNTDGLRYYFPNLGAFYEADPSAPSGLAGYPYDDVRAQTTSGQIPGRGGIPARSYSYVLRHLDTNATDYFSSDGDLLASINHATSARADWVWEDWGEHNLKLIVDERGQETHLMNNPTDPSQREFRLPSGERVRIDRNFYYSIWRFAPSERQTSFDLPSAGWPLPWFRYITSFDDEGTRREIHFEWDVANQREHPGRVERVLLCDYGKLCEVVYRAPEV